ncbi:SURF1 family protein [Thalassotalea fusca]
MSAVNSKQIVKQVNWLIVVLTLLVFIGLIKLGLWQSARAVEKEQRLARIEALTSHQALNLAQILAMKDGSEEINDLPVTVTGDFDEQHILLLDNQVNKNSLGYRVLQLVSTEHGLLLVNLGWVAGSVNRDILPDIPPVMGQHQFNGHVRIIEKGIQLAEQNYQDSQWPMRVQQIELAKISQLFGQKLLPFVVYLDKKESIGFEKNWQPIVMPPEKHRGYAFQWFSLAITWMVLMISASWYFIRNKNNNKKEGYESGAVE